jgi:hypothetical protein
MDRKFCLASMEKSIPESMDQCMRKAGKRECCFALETLIFFTRPSATFAERFLTPESSKSEKYHQETVPNNSRMRALNSIMTPAKFKETLDWVPLDMLWYVCGLSWRNLTVLAL